MVYCDIPEGAAGPLLGPVLRALDLGVLLEVGQHHDQLETMFPDHPPEIVDRCIGGTLRAYELFALLRELVVVNTYYVDHNT